MAAELRLRMLLIPVVVVACIVPTIASGLWSSSARPVKVIGTLEIGHYDDFRSASVRHFSRIVTKTGRTVNLRFTGSAPERLTGP
ncbi:MAG TPA: hypothetical protein VI503_00585 [Gaiellaceae bacterium]|nr:hypothetical protein [Gaiellaceae bacterium]